MFQPSPIVRRQKGGQAGENVRGRSGDDGVIFPRRRFLPIQLRYQAGGGPPFIDRYAVNPGRSMHIAAQLAHPRPQPVKNLTETAHRIAQPFPLHSLFPGGYPQMDFAP